MKYVKEEFNSQPMPRRLKYPGEAFMKWDQKKKRLGIELASLANSAT
jgi:hypothetical protein